MAKRARMLDGTIICSICSMPVRDDSMVCPLCGAHLEGEFDGVLCEACETVVTRTLAFCSQCRTPLPRPEIRESRVAQRVEERAPPPPKVTAPGISARVRMEASAEPAPTASPKPQPRPVVPSPPAGPTIPLLPPAEPVIPFGSDIAGRLEEAVELLADLEKAIKRRDWARMPEIAEMLTVTLDSMEDLVALSRQAQEIERGVTPEAVRRWAGSIERSASLMRQEIAELGLAWVGIGEREHLLEPHERALQAVESSPDPPEAASFAKCSSILAKVRGFHASRSETDTRASLGALRKCLSSLESAFTGKTQPETTSQPLAPAAKLDAAIWESESTRLLAQARPLLASMGAPMTLADAEAAAGPVPLQPPPSLSVGAAEEEVPAERFGRESEAEGPFEEEFEPPPPEWSPPPPTRSAPHRPHAAAVAPGWTAQRRYPTNGYNTNGYATNGYPTNGKVAMGARRARARSTRRSSRAAAAAFGATIIMVLAFLMVWSQTAPREIIAVDGDAGDWSAVPTHADISGDGGTADAKEFRAITRGGHFYALSRTSVSDFGSARPGTLYVLIDGDGLAATGLSHRGLGCELLARVVVDGGEVASATAYRFDASDRTNWSGWVATAAVSAAFASGVIEMGMDDDSIATGWRASLALQDSTGATDLSDFIVAGDAPSLRARLNPGDEVLKGAAPVTARLTLEASGGPVSVDAVSLGGSPVDGDPSSVSIQPGLPRSFDLTLRPGVSSPGSTVAVQLLGVSAAAAVAIDPGEDRVASYYDRSPAQVRIDGAFADWTKETPKNDGSDPIPARLDIRETRATNSTEAGGPAFLVSAAGVAMLGDFLPSKTFKPAPGPGGGTVVLPKVDGADSLLLYLDVGPSPSTGFPVGRIGADYLVSVNGDRGRVKTSAIAEWSGAKWGVPGPADANSTGPRVEVGVPKTAMNWSAGPGLEWHAVLRGWDGQSDSTDGSATFDPVILLSNGSAYASTGGAFTYRGNPLGAGGCVGCFADLATDGVSIFALRNTGELWSSADTGATWGGGPTIAAIVGVTDMTQLVTDNTGTFYSSRGNGVFYRCTAACPGIWTATGGDAAHGSHVLADLTWVSGTGAGATLYGVLENPAQLPKRSADGGTSWANFGAAAGTADTNVAIGVYSTSIYVLDRDGTLRTSNDTAATWAAVLPAPPACANCYGEMSIDPSNGRIFLANVTGATHYLDQSGSSWTLLLPAPGLIGLSGVVYVTESGLDSMLSAVAVTVPLLIIVGQRRRSLRAPPPGA